jgi:hypothetical protein
MSLQLRLRYSVTVNLFYDSAFCLRRRSHSGIRIPIVLDWHALSPAWLSASLFMAVALFCKIHVTRRRFLFPLYDL